MLARLSEGATAGDYVIERFLGAGAMGEVYAGKHPMIGKRVAIKVLRPELAASPEAAERFIREARAVNQVSHANVIDVFACGRLDDGRLYLAMDLVAGQSLRARLAAGKLGLPEALAILDKIADALDAAHAKGVVHRDLKPDNIMLGESGEVLVLDFGIAKLVSGTAATGPGTLTGQGTWLGTPAYMAPEQWSSEGAGPASDRYALGVIAFELLSGALPFSASSVPAMMEQHFRTPVPALSARGGAAPVAVDAVLRRAMAKDPQARYPTARAMVDALAAAAGTRASGRKRMWLPGAAGLGVLGIAVIAAFAMREKTEPAPATEPSDAPPPGTVTIAIASVPAHAQVLAGDHVIGLTPTQIYLAPGATKPVLVRKAGYVPERREVTAGKASSQVDVVLDEIKQFQGVWRLATGELRAFERTGEQVDVYKLQTVSGPREFYRHYAFAPIDRGVAFAIDEEMIDQRAPGDASCHLSAHVEYRYDLERDAMVLRRENVKVDLVGGRCVVRSRDIDETPVVRVDAEHEMLEMSPPAGLQKQREMMKKKMVRMAPKQAPNPPPPTPQQAGSNTSNTSSRDQQQYVPQQQSVPGRKN